MEPTRRDFLKTSLIAGAGIAAMPKLALASAPTASVQDLSAPALQSHLIYRTRGIGIYPGAPEEYFGPLISLDSAALSL
jgi:anaerobic selenocysteine-containing dehydrogenase